MSKGFSAALLAALLLSFVGGFIQLAHQLDPSFSGLFTSSTRIGVNLLLILAMSQFTHTPLFGKDNRKTLWTWGVLGGLTIASYFMALELIGMGEATLLLATHGAFTTLLAPKFLGQKNSPASWSAVFGSLIGIFIILLPTLKLENSWEGRILGIVSGISAGLAYCLVAQLKNVSAQRVSFYWCLAGIGIHFLLIQFFAFSAPKNPGTWILVGISALFASLAQLLMTKAYQTEKAAWVAASSYLTPFLCLLIEGVLFNKLFSVSLLLGGILILGCGLLIPLIHLQANSRLTP